MLGAAMKLLAQGDPRWTHEALGDSRVTIGEAGCLLTSLTMAAQALGTVDDGATPSTSCTKINLLDGFKGAGLVDVVACRALGLDLVERRACDLTKPEDLDVLRTEFAMLRPVVVGVDFAAGGSSRIHTADGSTADHFCLALGFVGDAVALKCADPAFGAIRHVTLLPLVYAGANRAARVVEFWRLAPLHPN